MNSIPIDDDGSHLYPINGLRGITQFLDKARERSVIEYLDKREWKGVMSANGRRVQQFGYLYDYKSRNAIEKAAPLEDNILEIALFLIEEGWLNTSIDKVQCICNEYRRDQCIAAHIDSTNFGDTIVTISLLEDTVMIFSKEDTSYPILLPRRSIAIMTRESRYQWKHCIEKKVTYLSPNGEKITKGRDYRRVSLTYRFIA